MHATSDRVELASATVSAVVGADGARATAAVKLPHKVRSAEAWIASVALETGVAQDLPSCYDPRHGWNPRRSWRFSHAET